MDKVIIVGRGIVGQSTEKYLQSYSDCTVEFHDPALGLIAESWREAQWCFVCVNTDFDQELGFNDDQQVFKAIAEADAQGFQGTYVVRSTVSLTTINALDWLGDQLAVWPEFVREKHWKEDSVSPQIMPIGGARADLLANFLKSPMAQTMTAQEAMTCKLAVNGFLATKVMFFNAIHKLCANIDMDFDRVLSTVKDFPGVGGDRHAHVPGHDGQLGYGGKCLPKDTRTLAHDLARHGADNSVIKAVVDANSKVRDE